jgi:hypothetical protein
MARRESSKRRRNMRQYVLRAEYTKIITINEDEDLDEVMDKETAVMPKALGRDNEWSFTDFEWEEM